MARFEVVTKYKDANISLPVRATANSAGYDLEAAVDITIPSLHKQIHEMSTYMYPDTISWDQAPEFTKQYGLRPILVSTGLKCYLEPGTYLGIVARSSTPYKYGLMVANSIGIIDADYVDNIDNEGEIFVQLLNFTPTDIIIHKGDKIAQAIIHTYQTVNNDMATAERVGGFGSTTKN